MASHACRDHNLLCIDVTHRISLERDMDLLIVVLALLFSQSFCSAYETSEQPSGEFPFVKSNVTNHELNGNDNGLNVSNCSAEVVSCIGTYYDLESYVKGSTDLIEKLRSAFFVTGKPPSKFIRFTYSFQINTIGEDGVMRCTSKDDQYIWSDQFLYLLGPRPLFCFTLFAVNVPEHSATIELPCLCDNAYNDLLSRLTYMVCKLFNKLCMQDVHACIYMVATA